MYVYVADRDKNYRKNQAGERGEGNAEGELLFKNFSIYFVFIIVICMAFTEGAISNFLL